MILEIFFKLNDSMVVWLESDQLMTAYSETKPNKNKGKKKEAITKVTVLALGWTQHLTARRCLCARGWSGIWEVVPSSVWWLKLQGIPVRHQQVVKVASSHFSETHLPALLWGPSSALTWAFVLQAVILQEHHLIQISITQIRLWSPKRTL